MHCIFFEGEREGKITWFQVLFGEEVRRQGMFVRSWEKFLLKRQGFLRQFLKGGFFFKDGSWTLENKLKADKK